MTDIPATDFSKVRDALAELPVSSSVVPNAEISLTDAYFPAGHRGVLDFRRQLVVGNRGMGKSFWTHALANAEIRGRLSHVYRQAQLAVTDVVIGFNGSEKNNRMTSSVDEIQSARSAGKSSEVIWRAVIARATSSSLTTSLAEVVARLDQNPELYSSLLSEKDEELRKEGKHLLIVFDALDRLSQDWEAIRDLSRGLLVRILGLQSFRQIHAKVFMRTDQFADEEGFRFPDSSKIRNDKVDLTWQSRELYGLLFFYLSQSDRSGPQYRNLVSNVLGAQRVSTEIARVEFTDLEQAELIKAMAGEFMGSHKKRGRLFSWVPLHLSDAANNCSPRTFLTAWRSAANHLPVPMDKAVDHLGIAEGVRKASQARLAELQEDFPWITSALQPLKRKFVPIAQGDLFSLWTAAATVETIIKETQANTWLVPTSQLSEQREQALLKLLASIGVVEERASGKINVPDIFRVEAQILRRGGVSVPRKN